jgi:surface protein
MTLLTVVFLMFSLSWNEDIIYMAKNQITLQASPSAEVGKEYIFEGKYYLIVDNILLREAIRSKRDLSTVITSKVTDMSYLFYQSPDREPKISTWDVSNVKTMSWMFGLAPIINPDLSHWDTGSVVDFSDMFNGAVKFQGDISNWDISSGELFNGMFFETEFNGYLNDWDMSSAKNLSGMFDDAAQFNQPLDKWDTSNVEDMGGMFAEAVNFDQDISMWNVSNVRVMTNVFRNALNFKGDLSGWEVPLITVAPEFFNINSPVISPIWNPEEKASETPKPWFFFVAAALIIPLIVFVRRIKKKKAEPTIKDDKDEYEFRKHFLDQKASDQLSRSELDEILEISQKTVESQKQARSNFIKKFNSSGQGEIIRIRDEFDSRSFNYKVIWKK